MKTLMQQLLENKKRHGEEVQRIKSLDVPQEEKDRLYKEEVLRNASRFSIYKGVNDNGL